MKTSYSLSRIIIIGIGLLLGAELYGAPPTNPPTSSSAPNGGYFAQYFSNMVGSCNLANRELVTGFDNSNTLAYGTKTCTPLATFLSAFAPQAGKVLAGFDGSGAPVYVEDSLWKKNGSAIYYNSGYVGIGTATPVTTLHLSSGNAEIARFQSSAASPYITLHDSTGRWGYLIYSSAPKSMTLMNERNGPIILGSSGTNLLHITPNGNVGVGGINPGQRFEVYTTSGSSQDTAIRLHKGNTSWWTMGLDTDDSNKFKVTSSGSLGGTSDRFVITSAGSIGIGTSSPGAKLHVSGTADEVARFESSGNPYVSLYRNGTRNTYLYNASSSLYLMNEDAGGLYLGTNNSYKLNILANGNVGIGTTNPGAKLSIIGDGSSDPLQLSDGTRSFRVGPSVGIAGGFNIFDDVAYGGVPANIPAATRFRIDNNGNVGIGITAPTVKLEVNGNIRTTGQNILNNSGPTVYFQDTDDRSAMIHASSNRLYFLRGNGNNSTTWEAFGGYWPLWLDLENNSAHFGGTIDAPGSITAPSFIGNLVGSILPVATGNNSITTGRVGRTGLYNYRVYSDPNAPITFGAAVGFGDGAGGSAEIMVNWLDNNGLYYRSLRDCCQNWSSWKLALDTTNVGNYALDLTSNQTAAGNKNFSGDINLNGKHAFRGTDSWLRLNQDGGFTSGVHTPGNFAPGRLNVGGAGSWGDPGAGNVWVAGDVGIGTTSPSQKLDVNGQVRIRGGNPGAGKVLTSSADGTASWQAAAGGGGGGGTIIVRKLFNQWETYNFTNSSNSILVLSFNGRNNCNDIHVQVNGQYAAATSSDCDGSTSATVFVANGETVNISVISGAFDFTLLSMNSGVSCAASGWPFCSTYSWEVGAWGDWVAQTCPESGNLSIRTRTVYCKDNSTGAAVPDYTCAGATPEREESSGMCTFSGG